jgi:hypothetical protein
MRFDRSGRQYCDGCRKTLWGGDCFGPKEGGWQYCRACAQEIDPEDPAFDPDNPINW